MFGSVGSWSLAPIKQLSMGARYKQLGVSDKEHGTVCYLHTWRRSWGLDLWRCKKTVARVGNEIYVRTDHA